MITAENPAQNISENTADSKDQEIRHLAETIERLTKLNQASAEEITWLKEQIATLQRLVFGPKKIKVVPKDEGQMYIPGCDPKDFQPPVQEKKTVKTHERKKPVRSNLHSLNIPEDCPVEKTIIDLPEEEKIDSETGEPLVKIGEEATRQLAFKSGYYFVKETIRYKYASPSREEAGVSIPPVQDSIIPKCRADESLLAEIVTRKYADHLPLYRLSEIFSRDGVQISRQLMSQWILKLGSIFTPLYNLMWERILSSGNVFIDETPVKLQVKGKGKLQTGYMWIIVGGQEANPPYCLFRFFTNRAHIHAEEMIKGFSGSLHSDKLDIYQKLGRRDEIIWHPCWEHAKRKFQEMVAGDLKFRDWIVEKIQLLAVLEREAWELNETERVLFRKAREGPIIDEIIAAVKDKYENGFYLPKSKYREALYYIYGLIPYLKNYLNRPYARMDNNIAERALRSLTIGRKNWLFVGSEDGGMASAVLLSLVQTCRRLGINPREYLEDIMRRFLNHPINKLDELLPDNWLKNREKKVASKPLHER
jgi:transposase